MEKPPDNCLTQMDGISIREVLDCDPRPTFVLDLDPDDLKAAISGTDKLDFLFCNDALRSHLVLYDMLTGDFDDDEDLESTRLRFAAFVSWATSITKFDDSRDVYPFTHVYHGLLWTGSTVRKRWRLISGNKIGQMADDGTTSAPGSRFGGSDLASDSNGLTNGLVSNPNSIAQRKEPADNKADVIQMPKIPIQSDELPRKTIAYSTRGSTKTERTSATGFSLTLSATESGTPDWTLPKPKGFLSDHVKFARTIDWGSTPLGPMKSWSRELRQMANVVMSNPHPASLFWGHDMTMLYNEAYRDEIAGNKHPDMMGTGGEGPFRELWDQLTPIFEECARSGRSVRFDNDCLFIERRGYLEETYISWSFVPLFGGGKKVVGFYNAPFEVTRDCLSHRRMQTLQRLSSTISDARTVKQFWRKIILGLESNHRDVPFALLYSIIDSDDGDEESVSSSSTLSLKSCILEGSIAVPAGHPAIPTKLDLKRSREGFIPSFREAMRTREPTRIRIRDGSMPEHLLQGIEWRGFGEPCKEAVIFPVRPTNGDNVLAFLLIGINPRREFDEDYQAFVNLLNRQLATALASALLFEEEMRKAENAILAANLQQDQLNEQLALQTNRLQRMTALSPLGMFYINAEGLILEANDRYYEMTLQDRQDLREMGWMEQLAEESKPVMQDGWRQLTTELVPWTAELKFKEMRPNPVNPTGEPIEYWVLASSQPEFGIDGKLRSVMGCITDISNLKWAQGLQERRLREAEERRRQQNEFIDITSHEMRNPLSAILQCADDIASTLSDYQTQINDNYNNATSSLISGCVESANTIALCVQHQKSIVDDILTVSKLDSNLLELAPIPSQPIVVAKGVMKMFESELLAKKIKFEVGVSPDYEALEVDWVSMDPSRVSQILINLMTNAIKFTHEREVRHIKMYIGASSHAPMKTNSQNFHYIPKKVTNPSTAIDNDKSSEEIIYIRIKIVDTGCGLNEEERQLLFQRFQQANPRTHAQYGGSGLGLFISRQLTELHGGQIGVASEAEHGSTFGFYIQTRRLPTPEKHKKVSVTANSSQLDPSKSQRPDTPNIIASHIKKEMLKPDVMSDIAPPQSNISHVEAIKPVPLRILVVEDNLVNQKVLKKQLEKNGSTVFVADNGQKALDFLETTEYRVEGGQSLSVILMDLEMPVMDGLTCVRNIRQMERDGLIKQHIPIIAVTANVRLEQVLTAKAAGMDDLVSKPFRIPELIEKINILLASNKNKETI